jgi:hypothetical protein
MVAGEAWPIPAKAASPRSCDAQAATIPIFIKNTSNTNAINRVEARRWARIGGEDRRVTSLV